VVNRRSLISLLIGVLASIVGLLAAVRIRSNRCSGMGGRWDDAKRLCVVPDGTAGESATQVMTSYLLGAVVALVAGFMLWRVMLFVTGRGPRPGRT
jgi:hypothetical protein